MNLPENIMAIDEDPLLEPIVLTRFLRTHHLPPAERFGQHFLVNREVLETMVKACRAETAVPVIEIGAGLGVLTRALARVRQLTVGRGQAPAPLIAVELDRRLHPPLRDRVREFSFVHVVQADILHVSPARLLATARCLLPAPYDVVGNIPYNITAPIFEKFLAHSPKPRRLTVMIDEAVADTITAKPPHMSLRAVSTQLFAEPSVFQRGIPPSAFFPPPAVRSAILTLATRRRPLIAPSDEKTFFRLVRGGFSQKRKTLANALSAAERLLPVEAARRIQTAGIDPSRRAQTLSMAEWKRLFKHWLRA